MYSKLIFVWFDKIRSNLVITCLCLWGMYHMKKKSINTIRSWARLNKPFRSQLETVLALPWSPTLTSSFQVCSNNFKGFTGFTHNNQFTHCGEHSLAWENRCMMSSVVLEGISKIWENNHDVIRGSWVRLETLTTKTFVLNAAILNRSGPL